MTTLAIQDIRAMLLQFERSSLKDLFFRSADWTMFLARQGGSPNPLLSGKHEPEAEQAPATSIVMTRAPHLGMFEPKCSAGEMVLQGDLVALLDVLGRKTEVLSPAAGRVGAVLSPSGGLVEFADDLIEIEVS